MIQVNVHGPGDVRLDDVPDPEPGPRDAVVRVAACGLCGTDLRYVRLGGLAGPTHRPMPLGHEIAGVVERVGREVTGLAPGARVVVHPTAGGNAIGNGGREGGLAPRLLVRDAAAGGRLFPVPDALPLHLAALCEPLGVGANAVDRAGARPGERVAVFGAGPIGLAAIAALRDRGVDDVVAIDLSPRRLAIAASLGARHGVDASREDPWTRLREIHGTASVLGAPMAATDAYVEASGAGEVIDGVLRHARAEARLVVVALHDVPRPVPFLLVMLKQLTIRGAMEYPEDFAATLGLLERWDLSALVGHRLPLERFPEALALAGDPASGGKVLIEPA